MLDVSEVQGQRFRRWWGMTDCEDALRAAAARGEAVPGSAIDTRFRGANLAGMASKTIEVLLPGELSGYVQRMVKGGRYQDASEVVREALRRMEAAELADELKQFERAFVGGHDRSETEDDIQRVEASVQAGRKG
jgi:putative addiction module CopG family antidote